MTWKEVAHSQRVLRVCAQGIRGESGFLEVWKCDL